MSDRRGPLCIVEGLILYRSSEKAILVGVPGLTESWEDSKKKVWIPRSQIEETDLYDSEQGEEGYVVIPEWLAAEKDLDGEEWEG